MITIENHDDLRINENHAYVSLLLVAFKDMKEHMYCFFNLIVVHRSFVRSACSLIDVALLVSKFCFSFSTRTEPSIH